VWSVLGHAALFVRIRVQRGLLARLDDFGHVAVMFVHLHHLVASIDRPVVKGPGLARYGVGAGDVFVAQLAAAAGHDDQPLVDQSIELAPQRALADAGQLGEALAANGEHQAALLARRVGRVAPIGDRL
jgi:hypothetical protein